LTYKLSNALAMEVHHHAHTSRKKWTHYFWEFFMLFLAVTLGFFVENQREHFVEHRREKQYMRGLYDDLVQDTIEINSAIARARLNLSYNDSLLLFMYREKIGSEIPIHFINLDSQALVRLQIVFTDRTASQLKNSGNMRLIREQEVVDMILKYWRQQERTLTTLERYIIYRNQARSFATQLFAFYEHLMHSRGLTTEPPQKIRVINSSPALWTQYANIVSQCGVVLPSHLINLERQLALARELMQLIRKEYL
jgi:hypothetical protein